jgi:hypothetical protein
VADSGQGLRVGQANAWPAVPGDGDVFHGLRTVTRLVAILEKRAYAAIARREDLEQQMQRAKPRGQGRPLSKPLTRARTQETTAIRLADLVQTLADWLQHDILALVGPDAATRQALYDFVVAALQDLEAVEAKRLRPVRRALANQRDTLLAFATRLDRELEMLARQFALSTPPMCQANLRPLRIRNKSTIRVTDRRKRHAKTGFQPTGYRSDPQSCA